MMILERGYTVTSMDHLAAIREELADIEDEACCIKVVWCGVVWCGVAQRS